MTSMCLDEGEEIVFVSIESVHDIHELALTEGGLAGSLKIEDLESALGRPQNAHYYNGECDLIILAAYLWHGVSSAHGYCDANKRTALLAALAFLQANGIEIDDNVDAEEPGVFVLEHYENKTFEIPILDKYLRPRCRWIQE